MGYDRMKAAQLEATIDMAKSAFEVLLAFAIDRPDADDLLRSIKNAEQYLTWAIDSVLWVGRRCGGNISVNVGYSISALLATQGRCASDAKDYLICAQVEVKKVLAQKNRALELDMLILKQGQLVVKALSEAEREILPMINEAVMWLEAEARWVEAGNRWVEAEKRWVEKEERWIEARWHEDDERFFEAEVPCFEAEERGGLEEM